jgi:uncharacterized glyoxalase superfamily protein PhnB
MVPLINVEDASRSIRFYTETLPFRVIHQAEADGTVIWALLACDSIRLMINQPDGASSAERRSHGTYRDAVLYFHVSDAREVHAALSAAGHAVSAVEIEAYGMEEFTLRDPDGYELAIGSPLTQIA